MDGKKRPASEGGAYQDASTAPEQNKHLNLGTEKADVRNDQFSRLYAPDGTMNNTRVSGKRGDKGKETVQYVKGAPGQADSKVPYYEVYGRYAPAAESAMSREDIPANYKKQVKDYFDALNPKKSGGAAGAKSGGR